MNKTGEDDAYPLVSIAVTTYNGGGLICKQIDSILSQTYQNFEIVISDDGSNKETIDILNAYTQSDKRIRWSRSPFNRGYIKNTQNAISRCNGEIIFLCDQDDWWFNEKIALHVSAYADPKVMWVYNRLVLMNNEEKIIGYLDDELPNYYTKERQTLLNYTWGSCIGGAMTSYRSNILKKAMPIGEHAPAHDSWIELAIYPAKSFFIDQVLQAYRIHDRNEVGWGKKRTEQEAVEIEQIAIENNLTYLNSLSKNKTLKMWKRVYFKIIYIVKILRRILKQKLSF